MRKSRLMLFSTPTVATLLCLCRGASALGVKSNDRRTSTAPVVRSGETTRTTSTPLFFRDRHPSEEQITDAASVAALPRPALPRPSEFLDLSSVSMPLVNRIWSNQVFILALATAIVAGVSVFSGNPFPVASLHWNEGPHFRSLFDFDPTLGRATLGALSALPMVALNRLVEQLDGRDASRANLSTTNMVISLFGRRRSDSEPTGTAMHQVVPLSALIAIATGISEEIVFRGYLPTAIQSVSASLPLALLASAGIFAIGHLSPQTSHGENKLVGGLQFASGLWYGATYLLAGGDILPCIIAHALSDMHVLCEAWHSINGQIDYTQGAFRERLETEEEEALQMIKQRAGPALDVDALNFGRRFFYAFDHERKGTLALANVQKAVTYAFLQATSVPDPKRVEELFTKLLKNREESSTAPPDRLKFSEFLRLLFALQSRSAKARA